VGCVMRRLCQFLLRSAPTRLRAFVVIAFSFMILAAGPARATIFDLSYTGPTNVVNAIISATLQANGSYLASSATGTWNGKAITLAAVNAYGGNDNLLFPGTKQLVQYNGITFANGSNLINIYSVLSGTTVTYDAYTNSTTAPSDTATAGHPTSLAQVSAPGPVPGSGLLSLGGLLAAGFARGRGRMNQMMSALKSLSRRARLAVAA